MPCSRAGVDGDPPDERTAGSDAADLQRRLRRDLNRYLRIRERSRQEVDRYLTRRGYPAAVRGAALEELCAERLLDDRRFAEMFVHDRRRLRPSSRRMVMRELRARGIAPETARAALAACDPAWDDGVLADELLAARWERWPLEVRPARAARLLARRGFASDLIRAAIARRQDAEREAESGDSGVGEDWR